MRNGFPGMAEERVRGNVRPSNEAGTCMLLIAEEYYKRSRQIAGLWGLRPTA